MDLDQSDQARRLRRGASGTLTFVMAGHGLLETGVDALFLANVSIERLPVVTIVIAFLALAVSRLDGGLGHRRVLGVLQIAAALGTMLLWFLVGFGFEWSYYLLYVWSGIVTSLIVVRFWLLLGDLFTISQGKRFFASIAMGGAVGALVGSGLSALVASRVGGEGLLVIAAATYLLSALGPMFFLEAEEETESREVSVKPVGARWTESFRSVLDNTYACRVALLVVLAGMTLTMGDFLFKSVLTEEVNSDDLAVWLSRIYFGLNVASIIVLALGTTPVLRRLGVDRSLAVLPALIGTAALGAILGSALVATIFLKIADGSLRYSLHKTASELLYLPMASSLRLSVKTTIDLVGQTGAKAIASLLILGLMTLPEARMVVASAVAIFSLIWIGLALRLRRSYLDVFRNTLSEGMIDTVFDHPELDLESAGSLIRALSDPDEARALSALRLLSERGQLDLVPSLILYHPSARVVEQALNLFAVSKREDASHLREHLVGHEESRVRGAAIRTFWEIDRDVEVLQAHRRSDCLVVRVSAHAGLLAAGETTADSYAEILAEAMAYGLPDPRLAAATAARLDYHPVNRDPLMMMAKDEDPDVAQEALLAIRGSGDEWFIPRLVELLGRRSIREWVRKALIQSGRPALDALFERLGCPDTPKSVQIHIPRTIARFEDPESAELLLKGLLRVDNGLVRFKILRGLESQLLPRAGSEQLRRDSRAGIDLTPLLQEFERTLTRSGERLELELRIAEAQAELREYATVAGGLLTDLLRDKRKLAAGRLFMMLGLLHPRENFRAIQTGLVSENVKERASAQELIETLLPSDVANPLMSLVSNSSGARSGVRTTESPPALEVQYAELLGGLMNDVSETLRAVALYHAGELELDFRAVARGLGDAAKSSSVTERSWIGSGKQHGLDALRDLLERGSAATMRAVS